MDFANQGQAFGIEFQMCKPQPQLLYITINYDYNHILLKTEQMRNC